MSDPTSLQLSDLLLGQLAAESYLDQAPPGNPFDELRTVLELGNNNPANFSDPTAPDLPGKTRMTAAQIRRFAEIYEIVDHQPNTWSGFSGTLLRNTQTDTYVLSFRSTESASEGQGGDWARDGIGPGISVAGADNEIAAFGFAIAQVADAEAYYLHLLEVHPEFGAKAYTVSG